MNTGPWCERSAGLLLHLSSLRGPRPLERATAWAPRIAGAGFRVWQFLPVGPRADGRNPFAPASAFAGEPALVADAGRVDDRRYRRFCDDHADWLDDWALFAALKTAHRGAPWWRWPAALRHREPAALARARHALGAPVERAKRAQVRFDEAWRRLRTAAHALGIRLFGDVPLYVARDSADVWARRELFEVDAEGRFIAVAGVPPDAFSASGQLWGLPPYRWDRMAAGGFSWWKRRFQVQAERHDLLRIDHFRGLAAWWCVPPGARDAVGGRWVPGPGRAALEAIMPVLHGAAPVAEDLGVITQDVTTLRQSFGLPGMRVLQFAFDGNPDNPHLPRNHGPDTVCYTGTHDNDTTLGWWRKLAPAARRRVALALGAANPDMPRALVELAWSSPAPLAIVPMQDLLGLGSGARMNRPGISRGNWRWSLALTDLPRGFESETRAALEQSGRAA